MPPDDDDGAAMNLHDRNQSYRNAIRLERHGVILTEIQRRLGTLDDIGEKLGAIPDMQRRITALEKAAWGIVAAIGIGFITAAVTWVVNGGLTK